MERYEYEKMLLDLIPGKIVNRYNLRKIAGSGWICMEIRKIIPWIKKSGEIVHD